MGALLHNLALLHHINTVGLTNGGKAMGDRASNGLERSEFQRPFDEATRLHQIRDCELSEGLADDSSSSITF